MTLVILLKKLMYRRNPVCLYLPLFLQLLLSGLRVLLMTSNLHKFQLVEEYNICECLCCVANINLPRKGQTKALYFTICIRRTKSTLKNSCYPEVM